MEVAANKEKLSPAKRRLLLQQMHGMAGPERSESIRPRAAGTAVPLSPEQRRVWLHALQHPELPLYNESVTIHRYGRLDRGILETSLNEILRRHEIWRTGLSPDGTTVIHDAVHVTLPFVDLSGLPAAEREAEALLIEAFAREPLDGVANEVLRAALTALVSDWLTARS